MRTGARIKRLLAKDHWRGDPQETLRLLLGLGERPLRVEEVAQRLAALIVVGAALRRQAQLACRSLQEGYAEPFLQRRHLAADGRDRHAKRMGRAAKALELRNPNEDGDIVEIGHVGTFAWAQNTFQIFPANREIAPASK